MSAHFPSTDLFLINSGLNSLSLQLRSISPDLQSILAEIKSALNSPSWNFSPFNITQLLDDAVVIETRSFTLVELEQKEAALKRLTESLQTSLKQDPLFDARYMSFDSQGILVWKYPDGENEANLQQKMREWPGDVFDVCNLLKTKWSVLTNTMIAQKAKGLFTNKFENTTNPSQALLGPSLSNPFTSISSLSVKVEKQMPPRLSLDLENVILDINTFLSTSAWSESTINSYTLAELAEKERELKGFKEAFIKALKKDPIFDGRYMQFHYEENCAEGNDDAALTHGLTWTYPQGERNGFENMERKKLECSNEIINVDDLLVKAGKNIHQAKKRIRAKPSSTADDWVGDSPEQASGYTFDSAQVGSKSTGKVEKLSDLYRAHVPPPGFLDQLNSVPSQEALRPRGKTEGGFSYLPGGAIPSLPSRSGLQPTPKTPSRGSLSITSSPVPEPARPVLKPAPKNTNPSIPVTNEVALARLKPNPKPVPSNFSNAGNAPAKPASLKPTAKPATSNSRKPPPMHIANPQKSLPKLPFDANPGSSLSSADLPSSSSARDPSGLSPSIPPSILPADSPTKGTPPEGAQPNQGSSGPAYPYIQVNPEVRGWANPYLGSDAQARGWINPYMNADARDRGFANPYMDGSGQMGVASKPRPSNPKGTNSSVGSVGGSKPSSKPTPPNSQGTNSSIGSDGQGGGGSRPELNPAAADGRGSSSSSGSGGQKGRGSKRSEKPRWQIQQEIKEAKGVGMARPTVTYDPGPAPSKPASLPPSPAPRALDPSESAALAYITRPGVLPAK